MLRGLFCCSVLFGSIIGVLAQTPVAISGDAAPGGGFFQEFHHFSAAPSGGLAFVATLSGSEDGASSGLFVIDKKRTERVLGAGGRHPFRRFVRAAIGDGDHLAVIAEAADSKRVLVALEGGMARQVVGQGEIPETGGAFIDFLEAVFDVSGDIIFVASTRQRNERTLFREHLQDHVP